MSPDHGPKGPQMAIHELPTHPDAQQAIYLTSQIALGLARHGDNLAEIDLEDAVTAACRILAREIEKLTGQSISPTDLHIVQGLVRILDELPPEKPTGASQKSHDIMVRLHFARLISDMTGAEQVTHFHLDAAEGLIDGFQKWYGQLRTTSHSAITPADINRYLENRAIQEPLAALADYTGDDVTDISIGDARSGSTTDIIVPEDAVDAGDEPAISHQLDEDPVTTEVGDDNISEGDRDSHKVTVIGINNSIEVHIQSDSRHETITLPASVRTHLACLLVWWGYMRDDGLEGFAPSTRVVPSIQGDHAPSLVSFRDSVLQLRQLGLIHINRKLGAVPCAPLEDIRSLVDPELQSASITVLSADQVQNVLRTLRTQPSSYTPPIQITLIQDRPQTRTRSRDSRATDHMPARSDRTQAPSLIPTVRATAPENIQSAVEGAPADTTPTDSAHHRSYWNAERPRTRLQNDQLVAQELLRNKIVKRRMDGSEKPIPFPHCDQAYPEQICLVLDYMGIGPFELSDILAVPGVVVGEDTFASSLRKLDESSDPDLAPLKAYLARSFKSYFGLSQFESTSLVDILNEMFDRWEAQV